MGNTIGDSILAGVFPDRSDCDGTEREIQEAGDTLGMHAYWVQGYPLDDAVSRASMFLSLAVAPRLESGNVQEIAEVREALAKLRQEVLDEPARQSAVAFRDEGPALDDLPF